MSDATQERQDAVPVAERIRQAEQLISEGKYDVALEKLRRVQAESPGNQYLPALVERTIALLYPAPVRRAQQSGAPPAETDEERKVRRLTLVAGDLYDRGSYEMAFQTLLKAFQMAPTSPHVLECQRKLAPAMEMLRKRGSGAIHVPIRPRRAEDERETTDWRRLISTAPERSPEPPADPQEARIEMLRRKKDLERRERELAMWREASRPPRVSRGGPVGS